MMAKKRKTTAKQEKQLTNELRKCGDCANVTEVWEPHQLLSRREADTRHLSVLD